MSNHARFAVGICDNDNRYPGLFTIRSHVDELKFHRWPANPKLAEIWRRQVAKGRKDAFNPAPGAQGKFVCSNHFPLAKRTPQNRATDYPTMYLTCQICRCQRLRKRERGTKQTIKERNHEGSHRDMGRKLLCLKGDLVHSGAYLCRRKCC